ncbi:nucleoside triphosphate pyrophosphohydrolase family protein [Nocardia wallacei]|uniref:MazG C-terminal domain-containing protein n=1 Tax=Nocardia wallacei TaxID=480035 RepID=A0A7G1KUL4_9NOCA|nr:nucleoside triphosphate pyrophosphohydrolase family protein [Nocardia wallacei]BCK57883.1 hypothetical protein NWFMUON74_56550 [Nocardia wallacei]
MEFSTYQQAAHETSQLPAGGPRAALQPMLGLAFETGSILNVYMRYLRDGIDMASNLEILREEIGDLLWYAAEIATASNLDLDEIAVTNLSRIRDRYPSPAQPVDLTSLPIYDADSPETERFPRTMVFEFIERTSPSGSVVAAMELVSAEPNAFKDGPVSLPNGKTAGYAVGKQLGDPLTDNSRHSDGYRYHDAIHFGFMAVFGWSPNSRALLRIKRKSDPVKDECEDGARAIFAEEGLAAVLSKLAKRRLGFLHEMSVDGEVVEAARAAAADLEVADAPAWLWRRAIANGFRAYHQLIENKGGYLIADLDQRTLTYKKVH